MNFKLPLLDKHSSLKDSITQILMKERNSFQTHRLLLLALCLFSLNFASAQGFEGYYRFPDVNEDRIVFSAEGDIWTVALSGGLAQRLTTHAEDESFPRFSPDGKTIAYSASYEGPTEVYSMPIDGGLPIRWTYERDYSQVNGWTPDGEIVYDTRAYATLPDRQLVTINPKTKIKNRIPLSQASEATFDATGKTIFFVRPSDHRNVTKRYKGGTARQIWKFSEGSAEAVKITNGYAGESHHPMWWNGRVYFITDRDGSMNIWSIDEQGSSLTKHTKHTDFDVRYAGVSDGNIVYQLGADLWHYDIKADVGKKIDIRLASDLDQLREKWEENPSDYVSSISPDQNGERVVITARGRIFVAPVKSGRMVEFTDKSNVRYRDAVFSSDGTQVYSLSDESGEFEFVAMPADGNGEEKSISKNGEVLRYAGVPSPDGKWIAYDDLESNIFLMDISNGSNQKISTKQEGIYTFSWSPDSKWIAFVQVADNTMAQIIVHNVASGDSFALTTDRANSTSPQWSPDGKFLYFISDRSFTTLVGAPWGPRQPEPYFDASEKLYHVALQKGTRSPFREDDELTNADESEKEDEINVQIDVDGIQKRIMEVPVPAGNYRDLSVNSKALYVTTRETGLNAQTHLGAVKIGNEGIEMKTIAEGISRYKLSQDGKKLLVIKRSSYYMINAGTGKLSLSDGKIDLSGWRFPIDPQEDWRQLFTDAWRMERDYFYDKNMHGVDWDAMHAKYFPLVDRVTTRNELSDLIGRFVGELSALHTSVRGGDTRSDDTNISVASLGARLMRDEKKGGFVVDYIYQADPDYPDEKSPLDDPYLDVRNGDVITKVNGKEALSAVDIGALIRNQVGKQVMLEMKRGGEKREIIVKPIRSDYNLRYRDWEYTRRLEVEAKSSDEIGYVHLRAMGRGDLNQWYREFYPVFDRAGLIIDVRHNRGGNIESFILEKLLRKAWMYWKGRSGKPYWNMQYAYRGHIVILVDENTASDGEAFADGFKRLNLGTAIGTRTWGGEIWLSGANRLSDWGIARAPMNGVYSPEGEWIIEGHGFEPDIVVDNLPHATFNGQDAQLQAAIEHLQNLIKEDSREVPAPPPYPDKSWKKD